MQNQNLSFINSSTNFLIRVEWSNQMQTTDNSNIRETWNNQTKELRTHKELTTQVGSKSAELESHVIVLVTKKATNQKILFLRFFKSNSVFQNYQKSVTSAKFLCK